MRIDAHPMRIGRCIRMANPTHNVHICVQRHKKQVTSISSVMAEGDIDRANILRFIAKLSFQDPLAEFQDSCEALSLFGCLFVPHGDISIYLHVMMF